MSRKRRNASADHCLKGFIYLLEDFPLLDFLLLRRSPETPGCQLVGLRARGSFARRPPGRFPGFGGGELQPELGVRGAQRVGEFFFFFCRLNIF